MAAPTISNEGTQSATISTEHTLATITTAGTYVFNLDLANLANGDTLEVRIKTKNTAGDTLQENETVIFKDSQGTKDNWQSDVYAVTTEIVFTIKQTAGTGRSFIWAVYAYS